MRKPITIFITLFILSFTQLFAQAVKVDYVEAELIAEKQWITPGSSTPMALRLKMDPQWHTYWLNPGDAGLPTTLTWNLPEGFEATEFSWPYPEREITEPLIAYGYSHEVFLLFELKERF